ncbi:MAG: hypothetical protein ACI9S9_003836, partial [Planctomycetota bacterium]
ESLIVPIRNCFIDGTTFAFARAFTGTDVDSYESTPLPPP